MLDPRLQYSAVQSRQRELAEQAARDRLAASQRVSQNALGGLLTAAGAALFALGMRLRGQKAPTSPHLADAAQRFDQRLTEANSHSAGWIIVRQQDGSATATSARVAPNRHPTPSEGCP